MSTYPLRVLVLEDEVFQRSVAVHMLHQLGCPTVYQAAEGAQALAILREVGGVDVAVCDLSMGGMDGVTFLQQAAAEGLIASVIIGSSLAAELRNTVGQMVSLLNITLLGDLAKPLALESLGRLLEKHQTIPRHPQLIDAPLVLAEEEEVREALVSQAFCAYFQPKFHLETGHVSGAEVLARWQHPGRGLLSPGCFMPVLEHCGLLDQLLFDQLRQGLKLQQQLKTMGLALNLAFNLHASQLSNPDLVPRITAMLCAAGLPGSGLTFELIETGSLHASSNSLERLFRLRMMGCRLSIDDFGAGFSTLQRLCQLPFCEIKLDAEFVRGLGAGTRCQAVISSTLALGDVLGMTVVVEGIETEEQRQQLLALGCIQGQGFWCARPMATDDLLHWLKARGGSL